MWPLRRTSELVSIIVESHRFVVAVCCWQSGVCVPNTCHIYGSEFYPSPDGRVYSIPIFSRMLVDACHKLKNPRYAVVLNAGQSTCVLPHQPSPELLRLGWHACSIADDTWLISGILPELIVHYQLVFRLLKLPLTCVVGRNSLLATFLDIEKVSQSNLFAREIMQRALVRVPPIQGEIPACALEAVAVWELERSGA